MSPRTTIRTLLTAAAAGLALACADRGRITAPAGSATAPRHLLGLDISLMSCTPLPGASASALIGPDGGTITVGPHRLVVPAGALSDTVTITATAPSGPVNLVQFGPQGLTFARPAALTLSYANCSGLGSLLPKSIAYTDDLLDILQVLPAADDLLSASVRASIGHFSGYAVAW